MEEQKAKEKRDKIMRDHRYEAVMNKFQRNVRDSAIEIDKLINSIDDVNDDLRSSVIDFEQEIDKIEYDRPQKHIIPGERIHKMMTNWAKE